MIIAENFVKILQGKIVSYSYSFSLQKSPTTNNINYIYIKLFLEYQLFIQDILFSSKTSIFGIIIYGENIYLRYSLLRLQ